MTLKVAVDVLQQEIDFHRDGAPKITMPHPKFAEGFIKGLEQAKELIRKVADREATLTKDPAYIPVCLPAASQCPAVNGHWQCERPVNHAGAHEWEPLSSGRNPVFPSDATVAQPAAEQEIRCCPLCRNPLEVMPNGRAWCVNTVKGTPSIEEWKAKSCLLAQHSVIMPVEVWDALATPAPAASRQVEIALGYIKRAAERPLPELPFDEEAMTERELAIFAVCQKAVQSLRFIGREVARLETSSAPVAVEAERLSHAEAAERDNYCPSCRMISYNPSPVVKACLQCEGEYFECCSEVCGRCGAALPAAVGEQNEQQDEGKES